MKQMKRRVFIAIPLPREVKEEIAGKLHKMERILAGQMRFIPDENWHITVSFLGWQEETVLPIIEGVLDSLLPIHKIVVRITGLSYGPVGGKPRMIWANTDRNTSDTLGNLKEKVENEFKKGGILWEQDEYPSFNGHITLARRSRDAAGHLPPLNEKLGISFEMSSIDLMESHLSRSGAEYELLHSVAV
jgi:2'-5' RNA ligase